MGKKLLFLFFIVFLASNCYASRYRIPLANAEYDSVQIRGTDGTRTEDVVLQGDYKIRYKSWEFDIAKVGRYQLWVMLAGTSTYTFDSSWSAINGKMIADADDLTSLLGGGGGESTDPVYKNIKILDNSCSIQDTINAITGNTADNRFIIFLLPGTYPIDSTITLRPYMTLAGLGSREETILEGDINESFIRADSGSITIKNLSLINHFITDGGISCYLIHLEHHYSVSASYIRPCIIENIYMRYTSRNVPSNGGILLSSAGSFNLIERGCRIKNCFIYCTSAYTNGGANITIEQTSGSSLYQSIKDKFEISNCTIIGNTRGILFSTSSFLHNYIENTTVIDASFAGIYAYKTSSTAQNNCYVYINGGCYKNGTYDFYTAGYGGKTSIFYETGASYNPDKIGLGSYGYFTSNDNWQAAGLYIPSSSPSSVSITAVDAWKKIGGYTLGEQSGILQTMDSLKVKNQGVYEVSVNCSFSSTAGDTIEIAVFLQNVLQTNLVAIRVAQGSTIIGASVKSYLYMQKNNAVSIRMRNRTSTDDIIIHACQFNIQLLK